MGERGNIVVEDKDDKRVYFYTHWRGSEITEIARKALAREQRWKDAAYLGRIVFCSMLAQEDDFGNPHDVLPHDVLEGEIGFGISASLGDNDYPVLVISVGLQNVRYENGDRSTSWGHTSFTDFIKPEIVEA